MKRNLLKRIGAVALAVAVSLTMGTAAFAAQEIPSGDNLDGIGDKPDTQNGGRASDAYLAADNTISIEKGIVFINSETTNVYEPNITYTYTISKPSGFTGATVTDEHNVTPAHTAAVSTDYTLANVVSETTATVNFADKNAFVSATSTGTELKKPFTFTFVPSGFTHAGVYRFLITETTATDARTKAGVVSNPTYAATRYLDVYVRNSGTSFEIYGYVLFEANNVNTNVTQNTTKSNGYVNTASSGTPADVDVYTTYNGVVSKKADGALADKTNYFPVSVLLTNSANSTTKIRTDKNESATITSGTTTWQGDETTKPQAENAYIALNGSTEVSFNGTFKDGGDLYLYGIPANTTLNAEETNNTNDVYTATAKVDNASDNASLSYKATSSATAATGTSAALQNTGTAKLATAASVTAKKTIAFTNTLDQISPTNVVMRFAPYLFILGAAIVLLVLMRRRRAHNAE